MRARTSIATAASRHHRHIDSNHVAFFNPEVRQHIGETAHVGIQFTVGDVLALAGVVAFPDDGGLIAAFGEVAVETIGENFGVPSSYHLMEILPGAKEVFFYTEYRAASVKDLPARPKMYQGRLWIVGTAPCTDRVNQATFRNISGNDCL